MRSVSARPLEASPDVTVAAELAGLAIWCLDLRTQQLSFNDNARHIVGGSPTIDWSAWLGLVATESRGKVANLALDDAMIGSTDDLEFSILRADGQVRCLSARRTTVHDQQGRPQRVIGVFRDITAENDAQRRQDALIAAVQHRVKNVLAVVRSVANRTLETSDDMDEFRAHFDGRLNALARVQNIMVRSPNLTVDLEEMVREEFLHSAVQEDARIFVSGDTVLLGQRVAELLGLAIHELVMNAVKFGTLSSPAGGINVDWTLDRATVPADLRLNWREHGVAVVDREPSRWGFGRELIERGLPYQLGARTSLAFLPGGVRCSIEVPSEI